MSSARSKSNTRAGSEATGEELHTNAPRKPRQLAQRLRTDDTAARNAGRVTVGSHVSRWREALCHARNGDVQKYSAIDQRGRALKVVQNLPKGVVPMPRNAIERGNQRADQERERRRAKFDDAITEGIEQTAAKKCIVKIEAAGGGIGYWDLASSGMGCPKGA